MRSRSRAEVRSAQCMSLRSPDCRTSSRYTRPPREHRSPSSPSETGRSLSPRAFAKSGVPPASVMTSPSGIMSRTLEKSPAESRRVFLSLTSRSIWRRTTRR